MDDDEFRCGICLQLFQDPRSLPCLHTFCRECLQRLLNEKHPLKCPVCRAKHELSEGAGRLPVDQYALQELPVKRLQQQCNSGEQQECKTCEKQAPVVAWCDECGGTICQPCVASHKEMVPLRGHFVRTVKRSKRSDSEPPSPSEREVAFIKCPTHVSQELKFLCTPCSEVVCSDCLLLGNHKDHKYSLVEEARHSLETKMEELASLVKGKKEEFSEYLKKAGQAEGKVLEYSESMESEVNNVFDGIVASVETQRNKALQRVSQGKKKFWSQKELVEVSLAELDSFSRFADHTRKCMSHASYVAMAIQGVKQMERLNDTHGDEGVLDQKMMVIGSQPINKVFTLGQQPSFKFSPEPRTEMLQTSQKITITVSLIMKELPVCSQSLHERCKLDVRANRLVKEMKVTAVQSHIISWQISFKPSLNFDSRPFSNSELSFTCQLTGDITTKPVQVSYYMTLPAIHGQSR